MSCYQLFSCCILTAFNAPLNRIVKDPVVACCLLNSLITMICFPADQRQPFDHAYRDYGYIGPYDSWQDKSTRRAMPAEGLKPGAKRFNVKYVCLILMPPGVLSLLPDVYPPGMPFYCLKHLRSPRLVCSGGKNCICASHVIVCSKVTWPA